MGKSEENDVREVILGESGRSWGKIMKNHLGNDCTARGGFMTLLKAE